MNTKQKLKIWGSFFVCTAFFIAVPASAQEEFNIRTFDQDLNKKSEITIAQKGNGSFYDFDVVDLGGDGVNEFIVTEGYVAHPMIYLYRYDGSLINSWQPYPIGYEGRINVATADLDGDGKDEIIVVPGEGGGPHVRIFDGYGQAKLTNGFFADSTDYRAGLEVAVADTNNDGQPELLVSIIKDNKNIIRFFDVHGNKIHTDIEIPAEGYFEPMKVKAFDLNGDNRDEIILGGSMGGSPKVFVVNSITGLVNSFDAYASTFRGGMDVIGAKINGQSVIITSAGYSGGPHVRFFDIDGNVAIDSNFFVYDKEFRGGVNVAVGEFNAGSEIVVFPQTITLKSNMTSFGKVIKVNLTEQRLYTYDKGRLIKSFLISSGRPGFDTPTGEFHVFKKRPLVRMSWYYGPDDPNNYDVPDVPSVLSFKGPYTIHAAWWHSNWGHVMSHGCVNVSMDLSEWLYDWTPLNTPVIITAN